MAQSPFLKRRVLLGILIHLFGVNFSCGIRFSLVRLEPMKQHKRPLLGPRGGGNVCFRIFRRNENEELIFYELASETL